MTTNLRTIAKLTGYALILMALIAGFALGFAFLKLYNPHQPETAQNKLIEYLCLYKLMLLGILMIILLDILVSWTLYLYFKNINRKISLVAFILRLIYAVVFFVATYHLTNNLSPLDQSSSSINANYISFQTIWSIGLIFFGFHLLLVGVLMKQHLVVPKILWYLTLLAGVSYIIVNLLKTSSPQLAVLSNTLNNILALPMALGELGLAIWLILKGGRTGNLMKINHL